MDAYGLMHKYLSSSYKATAPIMGHVEYGCPFKHFCPFYRNAVEIQKETCEDTYLYMNCGYYKTCKDSRDPYKCLQELYKH